MPVDIFAATNSTPPAPIQGTPAPVDIFAATGTQPPASNNMNFQQGGILPEVASDINTGLVNAGQGASNFLRHAAMGANDLAAPIESQGVYNKINSALSPDTTNYAKTFNAGSNTADKLIQGAAQYVPYAAGGEVGAIADSAGSVVPGLISRMASGGARQMPTGLVYGATQSQNPVQGAALGAGMNFLGGAAPPGVAAALSSSPIMSSLSKFAAPGLMKGISDDLTSPQNITNADAFQMGKANLASTQAQEKTAWNNANGQAQIADQNGATVDDSGYKASLNDKLTQLQNQSQAQSGFARKNQDAQQLLSGYQDDDHGSFQDMIAHNQSLNADYSNELTPGKTLPFDTVNYAISNLKTALSQNIDKNGLQPTLGAALDTANQATQQKNQIFNQVISQSGKPQQSRFSQFVNQNNPNADPSTFVQDYIPNSKADGTQKMQQLGQLLGSPQAAQSVLKQNIFAPAISGSNVDPQTFLDKFNNLSQEQQQYLFNPQQITNIASLQNLAQRNPAFLNQSTSLAARYAKDYIPGAVGGYVGHSMGLGPVGAIAGAGSAALGAHMVASSLSKALSNPSAAQRMAAYLTNPNKAVQANSVIPNSLGYALSSSTPNMINQNGGQ